MGCNHTVTKRECTQLSSSIQRQNSRIDVPTFPTTMKRSDSQSARRMHKCELVLLETEKRPIFSCFSLNFCNEASDDISTDNEDEDSTEYDRMINSFRVPQSIDLGCTAEGSSCWSICVLDQEYVSGSILWFRVELPHAANSTPHHHHHSAAAYHKGYDVLAKIDLICAEIDETHTFDVQFQKCQKTVPSLDTTDTRLFLKRMIHQSKVSHNGAQLAREIQETGPRTIQQLTRSVLAGWKNSPPESRLGHPDSFLQLRYGKRLDEMLLELELEALNDDKSL